MPQESPLLILCYEFPPYPSIGGRRWAKFAKYLVRHGYTIYVIAAKSPSSVFNDHNWREDVRHPNIKIHYLYSKYPYSILNGRKSFFCKVIRKVYSLFLEYIGKGIVQDKALFWKKSVLRLAQELIETYHIKNVISTAPPHRLNYYAAQLKEKAPDLNVICDFRDTWLDGKVYGLTKLPKRVSKAEAKMEYYTVKHADYLLFTYQPMLDDFLLRYPDFSNKCYHFPHNFDIEDYPENSESKVKTANSGSLIKFIYGGSVTTSAVKDAIIPFLEGLKQLKDLDDALYNKLEVVIYGNHVALSSAVKAIGVGDIVKLNDHIPEKKFYEEVANSDFLLSFLGDAWKDFITTKNISFLPFKKPIVLVSPKGLVAEFIEDNNFGYVIDPTTALADLSVLLSDFGQVEIRERIDLVEISNFSYGEATKKLMTILK